MNLRTLVALLLLNLTAILPSRSWEAHAANVSELPEPYEEMTCTASSVTFSLWAPSATEVRVNLYKEGRGGNPYQELALKKEPKGFWKTTLHGDQRGQFYTFQILYKGTWLNETPGLQARVVGVNGHRAVVQQVGSINPPGWEADVRPDAVPYTDMLLYQLQLRDYTMGKQSGTINKGKYLSLAEVGTTNSNAFSTGLDHLVDLGVTHVMLMPVFDFETDDESRPKQTLLNWNFQPLNFQVPEGSFATKPFEPSSRILEFKRMIQAFHRAGIRVVLNVTFSHTAFARESAFSLILPTECYRLKSDGSFSNASGYGNELATEQPFVRQYILQTLRFWMSEYHVDGFRFDQMGVMDIETVNQIKKDIDGIDPSIVLCGDGLAVQPSVLPETSRALAANNRNMPGLALFNVDWAVALRGNSIDSTETGFLHGRTDLEDYVKFGIVGGIRHPQVNASNSPGFQVHYAATPKEVINYTSGHEGFTLFDQLNAGRKESSTLIAKRVRLAFALLMTSQGIPYMYQGDEFVNSRSGHPSLVGTPDSICLMDWRNKTYFNDTYEYCRALVELRKLHPAFRMASAAQIQKNLRFLDVPEKAMVAYVLEGHPNGDEWKNILVVHNANDHPVSLQVPSGRWTVVVNDGKTDVTDLKLADGERAVVAPVSTMIAFQ